MSAITIIDPLSKQIRKLDNQVLKNAPHSSFTGVYISTNETGLESTRIALQSIKPVAQSSHIGFSGWHNFDIMIARKSSIGIFCDHNPEESFFMQKILNILRDSKDRFDFVKKAKAYAQSVNRDNEPSSNNPDHPISFTPNLSEDPIYEACVLPEEEIEVELKKPGSWLSTDVGFNYIRQLACADKIAVITEDFRQSSTFQKIKTILQDNAVALDSLYVSNIHEYMKTEEDKQSFVKTVTALTNTDTTVIFAERTKLSAPLVQKCFQLKMSPAINEVFFKS